MWGARRGGPGTQRPGPGELALAVKDDAAGGRHGHGPTRTVGRSLRCGRLSALTYQHASGSGRAVQRLLFLRPTLSRPLRVCFRSL